MSTIPVLDLFAGPGGLGEGFSRFTFGLNRPFQIALSIEKDPYAHQTLETRAFFRQIDEQDRLLAYGNYIRGEITRQSLLGRFPVEWRRATDEAWRAELGGAEFPDELVDERIRKVLGRRDRWVLIGGPPCQAYSLVGRSRMIGGVGRKRHESDPRHHLYKHYLRILAVHRPPAFVMENVKGLLSATIEKESIFERIEMDLRNPTKAITGRDLRSKSAEYELYSLVTAGDLLGLLRPADFVVRSEEFGVPQARHRVILLGVRSDIARAPRLLESTSRIPIERAIGDLPRLRSGLSREPDSGRAWVNALRGIQDSRWYRNEIEGDIAAAVRESLGALDEGLTRGGASIASRRKVRFARDWIADRPDMIVSNHESRAHIREDLHRYLFASSFAKARERSPVLSEFPTQLLPAHGNVLDGAERAKFADRFRVQRLGRPATTVTSHIAKDGHYFIHYDSTQCRSLTVREAARLQTFSDSYFFEGPRTEQYRQVGNAVPPLLALQIARVMHELLR